MNNFTKLCREAAGEGAVLLCNNNNVLPIKEGEKISLFGRCQIETYRSGTGSGGAVNVPYSISILQGLQDSKKLKINEELVSIYRAWIKEHPFDNGGGGWAAEPWNQEEMPLTEEIVAEASAQSTVAVVIIGRTAGEDKDNMETEGSYLLTKQEKKNIALLAEFFGKIVVVLNTANIIDTSWIYEYENKIGAVLYVWQGGMEGGGAVSDLLSGQVNPSGKLPDTVAYQLNDYPSSKNFGGVDKNYYQEDVYVGYRYFETFCPEKVQYPFGFGLSYTEFNIKTEEAHIDKAGADTEITIKVKVSNIGDLYSGKEVVQMYYRAPQGKLGKPIKQLGTFCKTKLLHPGESQELTLSVCVKDMASYDDNGSTGYKSCFVLEPGCYEIFMGNSIRDVEKVTFEQGEFEIEDIIVTEKLEEALSPIEHFKRIKPVPAKELYEVNYEDVPQRSYSIKKRIEENLPEEIPPTGDKGYQLMDVKEQAVSLEEFVAQMEPEELAVLVRGEGMGSRKVTLGTASAFGGVGDCLLDYGIPVACCADGPSGARIESGVHTTQVPIGTLLSASWNIEIVEKLYQFMGEELITHEIDTLLGPGMNIHRHPLNGRNFEYFSEDPLLTGEFASAVLKGLRKSGVEGTVKHFASNNQETNRHNVESVVSERALREIYLKPFEIAVKKGSAASVMTTYNPLNGYWTASNYDLNTTILRKQWGYQGIVMTDWWAKMNDVIEGGEGRKNNTASMVRAQNDLYMVVNNNGAEINSDQDNILEALENKTLTRAELQRSALNILSFILNAPVMKREIKPREKPDRIEAQKNNDNKQQQALPIDKKIVCKGQENHSILVDEKGVYAVVISMVYDKPNLYQSSCNIYMNQKLLANVATNGTEGQHVIQKILEVELEQGYYQLTTDFVKPGMEFDYIEFRNLSDGLKK